MRKQLLKVGGIGATLVTAAAALVLVLGFVGLVLNIVKGLGVNLGPLANMKLPVLSASVSATPNAVSGISVTA
jgi:hypothetical protein